MMMIAAMFEVCSEDGLRLCTERNNSSSTQGKAKKPIEIREYLAPLLPDYDEDRRFRVIIWSCLSFASTYAVCCKRVRMYCHTATTHQSPLTSTTHHAIFISLSPAPGSDVMDDE